MHAVALAVLRAGGDEVDLVLERIRTRGGGALDVEPLLLEDDDDEDDPVESGGVHGDGPGFAGNCRSTDPPHKLGPSAPQPETAFTSLKLEAYDQPCV